MAQYFYKKDARIKRVPDDNKDVGNIVRIKQLKENGYVQVLSRFDTTPVDTVVEKPKPKPVEKPKPKPKPKAKKRAKKK